MTRTILIAQMNGGTAVAGEDLIVRSTWKSKVEFESREAMNRRLRESDKVTAVKKTGFGYEVIIDATPGVTARK